jgi:hypothetical protein
MYIQDALIDLILDTCKFEYNGTHCPHRETPLYGRAAYWRAYLPTGTYVCKITTPVKTLNPKPATLRKLLKAELKSRIREIGNNCTFDHYGQVEIRHCDPSGVMPLVESIKGMYPDLKRSA